MKTTTACFSQPGSTEIIAKCIGEKESQAANTRLRKFVDAGADEIAENDRVIIRSSLRSTNRFKKNYTFRLSNGQEWLMK